MHYILIAEDNPDISGILSQYALREGLQPLVAEDGEKAVALFTKHNPVIALLDIMMPKIDGYEVCRQIRAMSKVPIIIVSAKGEEFEKIMGLDIGADDYIVKPFSPREVMARVRAVLRRMEETDRQERKVLKIGNTELNLEDYTCYVDGVQIPLNRREFETMWLFAENPNKVFTRDNLLDSLWGFDYYGNLRTVDSHIKRLRGKFHNKGQSGWSIKTVREVGYKLEISRDNGGNNV